MVSRKSTRRTEGQRRYDDVMAYERRITKLLDEIPYEALPGRATSDEARDTCITLEETAEYLRDAVSLLEAVRDREAPRYNRSKMANEVQS
jgi:hypothetical protein